MAVQHKKHHRNKRGNAILGWLILGGVFLIVGFYLFNFRDTGVKNGGTKATTTPVVVKPKPPAKPRIVVSSSSVQQGEAVIITAEGIATTTNVATFTFDNRSLNTFLYNGNLTAFMGVDLYAKTGTFPLLLTFKDGSSMKADIIISERTSFSKSFEIPAKLGGNTQASIRTLVTTLAQEGKIINALKSENKVLWTEAFRFPLKGAPTIEDPYGYTRVIGSFTMPHKGTDYAAETGTPVYSMNVGVVRFAGPLRNYGHTVVVDHGAGVQSVYMHLSSIKVLVGQNVSKGELLGLTGDTGYAANPHLHLTIRIWDISVDPVQFLEVFSENN